MNDAFQAILEFFIDLFSALSKFLGFDFDIGGLMTTTAGESSDESAESSNGE